VAVRHSIATYGVTAVDQIDVLDRLKVARTPVAIPFHTLEKKIDNITVTSYDQIDVPYLLE